MKVKTESEIEVLFKSTAGGIYINEHGDSYTFAFITAIHQARAKHWELMARYGSNKLANEVASKMLKRFKACKE